MKTSKEIKNITITLDEETKILVMKMKEQGYNPSAVVRKLLLTHVPALLLTDSTTKE